MPKSDPQSKFLKIALLALLLAVQVLGHAHAIDHGLDGDSTPCSICSVTGHGGGAIVDSGATGFATPAQQAVPTRTDRFECRTGKRVRHARAPPPLS